MALAKLLLALLVIVAIVVTEGKSSNSYNRGKGKGYGKLENYSYLKRNKGIGKLLENQSNKHRRGKSHDGLGIGITVKVTELDIMTHIPNTCVGVASGPAKSNQGRGRGRGRERRPLTSRVLQTCSQTQIGKPGKESKVKKNNGRGGRGKRQALTGQNNLWLSGIIYYAFQPNAFAESTKKQIRDAIAEFNNYTCIHYEEGVASTFEAEGKHYVRIVNEGVCTSYVGFYNTAENMVGYQNLSLAENLADPTLSCIQRNIIVHELTHAAGVFHHHTRTDRDSFVTVVQNHVRQGAFEYFALQGDSITHNIPYDYTSLLHYERDAFSKSGADTIVTTDQSYQDIIGKSPTLSFNDIKLLSSMYTCDAGCSSSTACPSQGFLGSGCKCYCPTGLPEDPVKICDEICIFPGDECSCSNNPSAACAQIANSECDAASGVCQCQNGFVEQNGECVEKSSMSCIVANEFCSCTENGCAQVPHSLCDSATGSCVCEAGFYLNAGQCNQIPDCTSVDTDCRCHIQSVDACNQLTHTVCHPTTGACTCEPPYSLKNEMCIQSSEYLVSDGSQIEPFEDVYNSWRSAFGTDADLLGIPSNSRYLRTNLRLNEWDPTYEAQLTADVTSGTWCMEMGVMLENSVLYTEYYNTVDNEWHWQNISSWDGSFYQYNFKFTTSQPTQVRISTGLKSNAEQDFWETKLDPLRVYKC